VAAEVERAMNGKSRCSSSTTFFRKEIILYGQYFLVIRDPDSH
jgi:hypothetical protein